MNTQENSNPEKTLYHLAKLKENPDYTFELQTRANCVVPINLKALDAITHVSSGNRRPAQIELIQLANIALGQGADPYARECGLLPVFTGGFHYEVWVAAQVRLRKAQAQLDYNGYRWGWITGDFVRQPCGKESKADPSNIIGVWGEVYRKSQEFPFYHETLLRDFKKTSDSKKGSWDRMETAMILKVNRDQTHKFAYADKMGNLNTEDELQAYNNLPAPVCDTPTREHRRKPVEAKPYEPVSDKEPVTDDADAGSAITLCKVYQLFCEKAGIENTTVATELENADKFRVFAAYALAVDEEEVDSPEKFTPEMITFLKRDLETNGIREDL